MDRHSREESRADMARVLLALGVLALLSFLVDAEEPQTAAITQGAAFVSDPP